IMVEDGSKTTGQNAMFSYEIMSKHPEIRKVVIVTSDYHVPWGAVLYQGEMILNAANPDNPEMYVAANAGCIIENPEIYPFTYQAAGLLELAGLSDTAMDIYMGRLDDPELE
ncbi:MAG: YdcF family protein, partial [Parasporobacterium sp.]|nr:YdcF family protein [Parasporobacterium sp.]